MTVDWSKPIMVLGMRRHPAEVIAKEAGNHLLRWFARLDGVHHAFVSQEGDMRWFVGNVQGAAS